MLKDTCQCRFNLKIITWHPWNHRNRATSEAWCNWLAADSRWRRAACQQL